MRVTVVKIVLLFLALGLLAFVKGEKTPTIKTRLDYFTIDNLGNVYVIKEDELVKYLPNQKFLGRYSNLRLGSITSVDATNPLKLLLYYHDFQQIVFLDNQLSVNSEVVSLEQLGHEQTELVCASANNSFWIYDKQNNELTRFNESSKKVASTGNLKQVLQVNLVPDYMTEYNGYLYLNCPQNGIYVFDIFGAFSRVIALKNLKQFQVNESLIYYKKDSLFCSYNYKIFEESCKNLVKPASVIDVKINSRNLYMGYKDSVQVIKLKE